MAPIKWTLDNIRYGIERFINEHGRPPTARDYDACAYLPTARQVQRVFGGMSKLREDLGYTELDYTKGALRSSIALQSGVRGVEAEESLEVVLIDTFGEPFVHTQKRYIKGGKSRYDFFIYASGISFGVDIFTVDRKEYISTNVRHKLKKYSSVDLAIPIYFVLSGDSFTTNDIINASRAVPQLNMFSNIKLMHLRDFLIYIKTLKPLPKPEGYISILEQI